MAAMYRSICSFGIVAFAVFASHAAAALPPNHPLLSANPKSFKLVGSAAGDAKSTIVNITGRDDFAQAIHVETHKRAASDYDIQCVLPVNTPLKKGDIIWASVWARMLRTEDESGQGVLGFVLEQTREPFDKLIQRRASVASGWQQLMVPARIHADIPAGSLHLSLRVGGAAQTLELGGVQLVRFDDPASIKLDDLPQTRITYGGREADAPWRKAAEDRIEQLRKAPLTVHVVDSNGKAVAGATVTIDQQQHAFPFGCVYSPNLIVGPESQTPFAKEYQKRYVDLFNVGVDEYAMKWPGWIDPATREKALGALQWMTDHNVNVRGHCLVWPAWRHLPTDLKSLQDDKPALAKAIDDHITDEVTTLKGKVTQWDVINEPYVNKDLMKILGYGAMTDWFKTARAADPAPQLFLNETSVPTNPPGDVHYTVLYDQVAAIQKAGGPIGGVGMQAHFGSNLTSITDLHQIYTRFASLGIPLEITELDISVGDEQLQADYLRDFMTISFSEPNICGEMMWGFVEGHHWRPDAALWKADWTIKPAGQAWLDLVKKKWWTHVTVSSGEDGVATTRGFLGDYTVSVTVGGKTQTVNTALPHAGASVEVTVR